MNSPNETFPCKEWNEIAVRFRSGGLLFLLLASIGWLIWFIPFDDLLDRSGTPLGGDFVMLYVAGQTLAMGDARDLYDDQKNQQRSNALFPKMDRTLTWPYRYPPTVAAAMAPLGRLSFITGWTLFLFTQILLLVISLIWMRKHMAILRCQPGWLWAISGSPLVIETIMGGQSSLLALACVAGTVLFLRQERFVLAGVALAIAFYKPNVLALFMVGCTIVQPRLLLGLVPTVICGIAIAVASCGFGGLMDYLRLSLELASTTWSLETPYIKVHGLAPYFQSFLPAHGKPICLFMGLIASVCIARQWRLRRLEANYALALLLVVNSLFNPYVPIYDLVLLLPALALACESTKGRIIGQQSGIGQEWTAPALSPRDFQWVIGLLFFGPHVSQVLAPMIGYQAFPIVLIAVVVAILWSTSDLKDRFLIGWWKLRVWPRTGVECHP